MLTVQAGLRCPETVRMGVPARTALDIFCKFPTPPVTCRIKLRNDLTGHRYVGAPGERIPTDHCGCMTISYDRLFVYDYLGLFCRRLRKGDATRVYIEPKPVVAGLPDQLQSRTVSLWKPKPGGGFSENHDLRLYRPGDDLRNIHWKLSSKTGKLIYREPVVPLRKQLTVTLELSGNLDSKLGRLLWTSEHLLNQGVTHEVRCLTGRGVESYRVADREGQNVMLRALLASPVCPMGQQLSAVPGAFHIGGDGHEA